MRKLGELGKRIFQGLVTGADPVFVLPLKEKTDGLIKVYSHSMVKEYLLESELIRPLLKGQDIKKWLVRGYDEVILFPYIIQNEKATLIPPDILQSKYPRIWKYLVDNKENLEARERGKWKGITAWYAYGRRQNLEQFDQPKIMTQVLASKASFALDLDEKLYFVGGGNAGGYGITFKPMKNLSLQYASALLNSALLDWHLKKSSSRFRGGFYSYARRFLEGLPIKVPETTDECALAEKCEKLVNRILLLKKAQYVLLGQWNEWAMKLKNDEQSLETILTQDRTNLRGGTVKELWTSKVSFYPPECSEALKHLYNDFRIFGSENQSSVKVFGINEDNNEEQIYELEFQDRDLMLHFYHAMIKTLESRAKVKTLSQLLAKTSIPIVKEVNKSPKELTPNIIKKAKEDFEKWKTEKNIAGVDPDIVAIKNEIDSAEAGIDALVFKLYELQENEINTVFYSLKTFSMHQAKVLEIFGK